jgi:very-short-patch-repair endonuclease
MLDLKFKRQHPIAGVIVDFYCAELGLVLEVDGGVHADPDHVGYDAARTAHLEARGLRVVRVQNEDVSEETFRGLLRGLVNRPPLPEGERGQG